MAFNPQQARAPAGSPEAGQWITINADPAYAAELSSWAREIVTKDRAAHPHAPSSHGRGVLKMLMDRKPDDPIFALAKHIESKSDRESMLIVLESENLWNGAWVRANKEWQAAFDQGAHHGVSKDTAASLRAESGKKNFSLDPVLPLTAREKQAFRARTSFTQAWLMRENGGKDTITLYYGVQKAQAVTLKGKPGAVTSLKVNALSSWSSDQALASTFALSTKGLLLKAEIPIRQIFSLPRAITGHSWLDYKEDRGEHVVLSSTPTIRALIVGPGAKKRTLAQKLTQ